jgi:glyoxylase-like metal-dependent hydrolase (beta-lactamase superfamily II)
LLVIAIATVALLYLRAMQAETAKMSPLDSGEVVKGVYAIRDDYVNLYLVCCGEGLVGVDAGIDEGRVQREMDKLGLKAQDVAAVFLTHTDTDHVGAINLFPAIHPVRCRITSMTDLGQDYLFTDDTLSLKDGRVDVFNEFFKYEYTASARKHCQTLPGSAALAIFSALITVLRRDRFYVSLPA